ncbi:penicillin-binding transpeptidase domain-containing protein [Spongiactinospora sp. TRM90649]|uniref:penicillin-binding transpeptidase domain-containing protein n=1 Tax=Spongiactinospora sp. TRM90649 TaxID=3031114 RepID=UPI0023F9E460|nr:penicillin-binding transpeptidase domain-containing protein [Spongiactinospora sp. TRM90649]MDF5757240.1 penicillin-binding transpeptidase domain-containing protein [Spongiactinospora sp. TRM90649]
MRRLLVLLAVALVVMGGAGAFALYPRLRPIEGTPDDVARAYLAAWRAGDLAAMRALVADPPADFTERHRYFDRDLRVTAISVQLGRLVIKQGEESARIPFEGTRQVRDLGPWPFGGTVRLGVRNRQWKVIWGPETMHPALRDGGSLRLTSIRVPTAELLTSGGEQMPRDHAAEPYLAELGRRLGGAASGWAIEAVRGGRARRLVTYQPPPTREIRTTLSRPIQAAAARALDGVPQAAAIVAVRAGTGEVLAVADRLGREDIPPPEPARGVAPSAGPTGARSPSPSGTGTAPRGDDVPTRDRALTDRGAFEQASAPGGAFQVVTAAALLSAGMTPESKVSCPRDFTPAGTKAGPIANPGKVAHGTLSLAKAFELSCDTAFARQAVDRLDKGELAGQAAALGFGRRLASGVGGTCGSPPRGERRLAYNAVGGGGVKATPLCMALVAAAVESGTWHPPRLLTARAARALDKAGPRESRVPKGVLGGLRSMLRAEAAAHRLVKGSAGHAGVTQTSPGDTPDAWFIGYHEDVAFAVLVKDGGPARKSALPIAARFLRAL